MIEPAALKRFQSTLVQGQSLDARQRVPCDRLFTVHFAEAVR